MQRCVLQPGCSTRLEVETLIINRDSGHHCAALIQVQSNYHVPNSKVIENIVHMCVLV